MKQRTRDCARWLHRPCLGLILFGVVLTGCGSHAQTSSHIFAPFNGGSVAAGVKITKAADGYCWTGSSSDSGRPDAWRCFLGNYILDPCFSNEADISGFVLCAASPWSSVMKLRLTKSLPRSLGEPRDG